MAYFRCQYKLLRFVVWGGGGVGWISVEGAISQSFSFLLLFLM